MLTQDIKEQTTSLMVANTMRVVSISEIKASVACFTIASNKSRRNI